MFNYTNTIVLNSVTDTLSGLDKLVPKSNSLEVRRVMKFEKPSVVAIYKRKPQDAVIASADLKMGDIYNTPGFYRLKIYIRLSGSQNSFYSNDFVFKGKPFYVEFEVKSGDTAAGLAERVAKIATHLQQMYGNKYMKFSAKDGVLTLSGVDEFQRFTQIEIQKFDSTAGINQIGEFKTIHTATVDENETGYKITQGKEAFGDYFHILKDLRLPTVENTSWTSINAEEMPVPGRKYIQYTIHYEKNRGQVAGGGGVGQVITSQTTHVFYVNSSLETEFDNALKSITPAAGVTLVEEGGSQDIDGGHPTAFLSVASLPTLVSGANANTKLVVKASETPKVTTTVDWITKSSTDNSLTVAKDSTDSTKYDVTVTTEANTSGKDRVAILYVKAGDQVLNVKVTQPKA